MRFFHTDQVSVHDYLISPLYGISDDHSLGLWLGLIGLAIGFFLMRRHSSQVFAAKVSLLLATGTAHLGLALGHEPEPRTFAFLGFGAGAIYLALRARRRDAFPRRTLLLVVASLITYVAVTIGGEAPDQVGLLVKMAEIAFVALALASPVEGKTRAFRQSFAVVGLTILVGAGAWAGAFQGGGHNHELGEVPAPGLAIPDIEPREPTGEEIAAADELYWEVVAELEQYQDVRVAAAAGYEVDKLTGLEAHADNPRFKNDGHVFDPERPETLVYADGPNGPVLLGAMFQTDDFKEPGPAIGGPLTVWHAHDHICFGFLPPALTSFGSPTGMCPLGTVTMALSGEMIHVWTIDGAPSRFGDLPDEWVKERVFG